MKAGQIYQAIPKSGPIIHFRLDFPIVSPILFPYGIAQIISLQILKGFLSCNISFFTLKMNALDPCG